MPSAKRVRSSDGRSVPAPAAAPAAATPVLVPQTVSPSITVSGGPSERPLRSNTALNWKRYAITKVEQMEALYSKAMPNFDDLIAPQPPLVPIVLIAVERLGFFPPPSTITVVVYRHTDGREFFGAWQQLAGVFFPPEGTPTSPVDPSRLITFTPPAGQPAYFLSSGDAGDTSVPPGYQLMTVEDTVIAIFIGPGQVLVHEQSVLRARPARAGSAQEDVRTGGGRADLMLGFQFLRRKQIVLKGLALAVAQRWVKCKIGSETPAAIAHSLAFAPIAHLCQCSGAGKTRCALEMARFVTVLYFRFGNIPGNGASPLLAHINDFFKNLGRTLFAVEYHAMKHVIMQRILWYCRQIPEEQSQGVAFNLSGIVMMGQNVVTPNIPADELVQGLATFALGADVVQQLTQHTNFYDESMFAALDRWHGLTMAELEAENTSWLNGRHQRGLHDTRGAERELRQNLPKLLIVFDEAHNQMAQNPDARIRFKFFPTASANVGPEGVTPPVPVSTNPTEPVNLAAQTKDSDFYRGDRGMFRWNSFYWRTSLVVTVSTSAKIGDFYPHPANDPSAREVPVFNPLPPIIFHGAYDVFIKRTLNKWAFRDWRNFIFGVQRPLLMTLCGRALLGVSFGDKMATSLRRLLQQQQDSQRTQNRSRRGQAMPYGIVEAMGREETGLSDALHPFRFFQLSQLKILVQKMDADPIFQNDMWTPRMTQDVCCTLLGLSLGMHKFPVTLDIAEMVRARGMYLLELGATSRQVRGVYVSEGILNGMATHYLVRNLGGVLGGLRDIFLEPAPPFVKKGEFGELLLGMAVLSAMVRADRVSLLRFLNIELSDAQRRYLERMPCDTFFEPVPVEAFLDSLIGEDERRKYLQARPELAGAFLAFNHLAYMGGDRISDPYNVVANCLMRGSACVPREGHPGVDLLLPLILRDGRLSMVHIQCKTGNSYKRRPSDEELQSSSPNATFPEFFPPGEESSHVPYMYIYVHLTDDDGDLACEVRLSTPVAGDATAPLRTSARGGGRVRRGAGGRASRGGRGGQSGQPAMSNTLHQPCLVLRGNRFKSFAGEEGRVRDLLAWFSGRPVADIYLGNDSLRRAWENPRISEEPPTTAAGGDEEGVGADTTRYIPIEAFYAYRDHGAMPPVIPALEEQAAELLYSDGELTVQDERAEEDGFHRRVLEALRR